MLLLYIDSYISNTLGVGHLNAIFRPLVAAILLVAVWQLSADRSLSHVVPTPYSVATALSGLATNGTLARDIIASVFRMTWGFLLACVLAIPCGMFLALHRRTRMALNPLLQLLRPISPLAWIPLSVLWFGIGDLSAIFLIFIACAPTLVLITLAAVSNVKGIYINAGQNFGLSGPSLLWRVIVPAAAPQLLSGMRSTLAIAWSVLVAGEMIAVNSGLGFLIMDARNAGNRFDLVFAGMLSIGIVGLGLDAAMGLLERTDFVRWSLAERA
jgi:NitT/TauT family transport system permease protein